MARHEERDRVGAQYGEESTSDGGPPERQSLGRLMGPAVGLALPLLVLVMSFVLGTLGWVQFAKGLVAVAVAVAVAMALVIAIARDEIHAALKKATQAAFDAPLAQLRMATTAIEAVVRHLEAIDEREETKALQLDDGKLARIEGSPATTEVFICRREMGDEFVSTDRASQRFAETVRSNLSRGVKYVWLTEDNAVSRHREDLIREQFGDHLAHITIHRKSPTEWQMTPFAFEAVFIIHKRGNNAREILGYADASFGLEAHRIWRRIGENLCIDWYDQVRRLLEQA